MWSIFIVGYMSFAKRLPFRVSGCLAKIGEASYSIYLLHVPLLVLMSHWLVVAAVLPVHTANPRLVSILVGLGVFAPPVIMILMATFRMIERPFLRARVRYIVRVESTPGIGEAVSTRIPASGVPERAGIDPAPLTM